MQLGAVSSVGSTNFKSYYEPDYDYNGAEFDYDLETENDSFEKTSVATSPDELSATERAEYDKKEAKIKKNVSPWAVLTGGAAAIALPKYGAKGATVAVNSAAKIAQYVSTAAVKLAAKVSTLFSGKINPETGKKLSAFDADKIVNTIETKANEFVSPKQKPDKVDTIIKDFTNSVFSPEKAKEIQKTAQEAGIVNGKGAIVGLAGTGIALKGADIVSDEVEDKIVDPTQKRQALAEVQGLRKNPAEVLKVIADIAS